MTLATQSQSVVSDEDRRKFIEDGFFVLENVIPPDMLQMLRDESKRMLDIVHKEMDAAGTDNYKGQIRDNRYFIANRHRELPHLHEFLFSDLMADICRATLGPKAYLFYEQWVIKGAEKGVHFSWHQDSGYVQTKHKPYLTCWCTLDDVNEENGTVYMLPYKRAGSRERIEHERKGLDLVGYHGDDPGDPVIVPAGSIACFSSVCFHRSGANKSKNMRRIYLAQYSSEPITRADGTMSALAEPFLKDGVRVR
jgi:ectoine hydroxylase-related dioxygenase (phytanoyl-CoA dioxygenase family)